MGAGGQISPASLPTKLGDSNAELDEVLDAAGLVSDDSAVVAAASDVGVAHAGLYDSVGVPADEATPLQNVFGFFFTAFSFWYFARAVRKRSGKAREFRVANRLPEEERKKLPARAKTYVEAGRANMEAVWRDFQRDYAPFTALFNFDHFERACLLALIEAGACVNVANQDGERPISLCAEWAPDLRATRACAALLAAGADVCYRGPDGRTPERRALDVGNVEAAAVMRAAVRAELESRQRSLIDEEEREAEATGAKAARSPAKPKQGGGRRR